MSNLRDRILQSPGLTPVPVPCPEWGEDVVVHVHPLSGDERDALEEESTELAAASDYAPGAGRKRLHARAVVRAARDAEGKPMFQVCRRRGAGGEGRARARPALPRRGPPLAPCPRRRSRRSWENPPRPLAAIPPPSLPRARRSEPAAAAPAAELPGGLRMGSLLPVARRARDARAPGGTPAPGDDPALSWQRLLSFADRVNTARGEV